MEGWLHRGPLWALLIVVLSLAAVVAGCSCEEAVTVPDLVGLEETEARDALSDADLGLGDVERLAVETEAPEIGTVLSQVPSAGSEVDSGSEVSLVVAEGPEEEASEEDEEEEAPADSSESGADSGSAAEAGADPDAKASAKEGWHTVDAASGIEGNTDYQGALFTLNAATPLELTVTVSSSPAGGEVRFILFDAKSGAPIHHGTDLNVTISGATSPVKQTFEPMTMPAGRYQMHVTRVAPPPMTMKWSYTLREWR